MRTIESLEILGKGVKCPLNSSSTPVSHNFVGARNQQRGVKFGIAPLLLGHCLRGEFGVVASELLNFELHSSPYGRSSNLTKGSVASETR